MSLGDGISSADGFKRRSPSMVSVGSKAQINELKPTPLNVVAPLEEKLDAA